jgi:UDP-4-amino-4,6-dideoxy-L-N-acetyl-beta-L-altrosamine transaminase
LKKYSYSKQKIYKIDLNEVQKTLYYKNLSRGSLVKKFEDKLCNFTNAKYSLAVNSGTSALILAVQSLSLKKNSYIAVPNVTFVASANSILLSGYKVLLVDVNNQTGLVDYKILSRAIKSKNVSCFINVHLNGNVSNLNKIYKLCRKNNIKIIDDACHALGTSYKINKKNYKICDNTFCDISTLSFHPTKIVTTGEGGALLTNNKNIYQKALKLMNHGYEKSFIKKNGQKHAYYKIVSPGYNFRLSDINCALGYSQLKNIKKKISHRRKIASFYNNYFKDSLFFNILSINKNIKSSYHLYPLQLKNNKSVNKIKLINRLKEKKIFTQIHYLPLNRQPLYKSKNSKFPNSQIYFEKSFSIPIHDDITIKDAKKIAKIINYECSKI